MTVGSCAHLRTFREVAPELPLRGPIFGPTETQSEVYTNELPQMRPRCSGSQWQPVTGLVGAHPAATIGRFLDKTIDKHGATAAAA